MSRVGQKPVPVPDGVKVQLHDRTIEVEGPQGSLQFTHRPEVDVRLDESAKAVTVTRDSDERFVRSLHGMTRSLIANMVEGCLNGFTKQLEVYGVGYGVQVQGGQLSIQCGFSHPAVFEVPRGLSVEVTTANARGDNDPARFTIKGADKQAVGEFAAEVRRARPPEPYKGKGIRYQGEYVRRKAGKAGKAVV